MEIKNNLENKAKFFAMYWGIEETGSDNYSHIMPDTWTEFPSFIGNQYLILTPLSQISDEDAFEIAKIEDDYLFPITRGKSLMEVISRDSVILKPSIIIKIMELLRSKGYALPWMGVDVETLAEWGWVKLKGGEND